MQFLCCSQVPPTSVCAAKWSAGTRRDAPRADENAPGSAGTRRVQARARRDAPGRAARRPRAHFHFPTLPNPPTVTTLPSTLSQASAHSLCDRNVHDPTTLRDVSVLPQIIYIYIYILLNFRTGSATLPGMLHHTASDAGLAGPAKTPVFTAPEPLGARNGRSSLPGCRQGVQNGRSGLPGCCQGS